MTHPMHLDNRNIIVTGAAQGIGAAAAQCCARLGARLILLDRAPLETTETLIAQIGGTAQAFQLDLTNRRDVEDALSKGQKIDGIIANAGISPFGSEWHDTNWDDVFKTVIDVNLLGTIHVIRAAFAAMQQAGYGRIVVVSSLAGRSGGLIAGAHYTASKGGLIAFTKWLARRGAKDGITANCVCPASIDTPMMQGQPVNQDAIPLGRMGKPEEVGWPCAFLVTEGASYITGATLDVNGGVFMG